MKNLFIDIETYSEVDIKKSGSYKYIEDDSFEILLIAYAVDNEPVRVIDLASNSVKGFGETAKEFKELYKTCRLHAHNANFERNALDEFLGYKTPINRWHCTMALAASCGLPLSLDKVSEVLELENAKMKSGKALINYFCKPCKPTKANGMRTRNLPHHSPEKWEEFKEYCRMDVEAEREIHNRLKTHVPTPTEREVYILDQEINDFGVGIDLELASAAIEIDNRYKDALKERVIELTGVDNPGSRNQLIDWLNEAMDSEVTTLRKADIPELLKETDCPAVAEVLKARQGLAKTSTAKYVAMIAATCKDSRARGLLQYYGANRTGRHAGRLLQVQNLPQNHLDPLDFARDLARTGDIDGIEMYFGNPADTLSQLIRTAFVPREGKKLGVADFSAIEARVIAWLADERWRLDVFKTHGKIYEASAAMMFGVPIEQVTKGSDYRAKGKVSELALGYAGGVSALKTMGGEKMGLDEDEMQTIVNKWRKASPNIVKFWYAVGNAFLNCVKTGTAQQVKVKGSPKGLIFRVELGCATVELPSGRRLFYWKPEITINRFGNESVRYKGMNQMTKQWGWVETYHGKLVENLTQAIARDLLMECMLKVNPIYPIVMHIHDELVVEAPESKTEQALKEICGIMGEEIEWAKGLPLRGEGFTSTYYKKD